MSTQQKLTDLMLQINIYQKERLYQEQKLGMMQMIKTVNVQIVLK